MTHADVGSAAVTLKTEHRRLGRPCPGNLRHVCPASIVTCTDGRLRPATIHHTRRFTMLAGQEAV
jgi:hypothetical protein